VPATRLRRHLNLPVHVIAAILGVHGTTISHAVSLTESLLAGMQQPPAATPPGTRLRTLEDLREYAAGHGITVTGPSDAADTPPDDTLATPAHRKLTLFWNAYPGAVTAHDHCIPQAVSEHVGEAILLVNRWPV
jgi:hypothetical protein